MKNFIYLSALLFSSIIGAQNVFFNTGVNMTTYDYSNSSGKNNNNIQSSNGAFYEMGYGIPLQFNSRYRGRYSITKIKMSLTLNEYNATGGNSLDNYDWKTQYLGFRTNLEYFILDTDFFTLALDGGVDGLDLVKKLLLQAKDYLFEDGLIVLEVGYDQTEATAQFGIDNGYKYIKTIKDFAGHNRHVVLKK